MKLIPGLILSLALAGCATPPAKMADTPWPEVTIATVDRSAVKQNLIARNLDSGWTLEQETENTLLFTQVDSTGHSAFTQVMLGSARSTPLKYEARYVLAQTAGGLRLVVNAAVSTQTPGGQVNRMPLDDATTFNSFHLQLQKVKAETERKG